MAQLRTTGSGECLLTRRAAIVAGAVVLAALGSATGTRFAAIESAAARNRKSINRRSHGRNRNRHHEKSVSIPGEPGTDGTPGQVNDNT